MHYQSRNPSHERDHRISLMPIDGSPSPLKSDVFLAAMAGLTAAISLTLVTGLVVFIIAFAGWLNT